MIMGMDNTVFWTTYLSLLYSFVEAKEQVLANLANFAYDPRNMGDLRRLQVTELFLDMLTEENENFVEFGIGMYQQTRELKDNFGIDIEGLNLYYALLY